jgi:hypothetical protein
MTLLTQEQKNGLNNRLNELFPDRDMNYNDPSVLRTMMRDFWSSRVDRLTTELRRLDQSQLEAASSAWRQGVV